MLWTRRNFIRSKCSQVEKWAPEMYFHCHEFFGRYWNREFVLINCKHSHCCMILFDHVDITCGHTSAWHFDWKVRNVNREKTHMSATASVLMIILWWMCGWWDCWWHWIWCSTTFLHANWCSSSHIIGKTTPWMSYYRHPINHCSRIRLMIFHVLHKAKSFRNKITLDWTINLWMMVVYTPLKWTKSCS